MRTILIAVLLAGALVTPALAQERQLSSLQLQDYVGQYALADGRTVNVTQQARRLVAQVEGQEAVVLTQAGAAQFIARRGAMHVAFDQRPNGVVTGVELTMEPGRNH